MSGDWRRPKVTTPSEDQHIKVAEVVWASDPDASWLTAFRGFSGYHQLEETPGQTQNSLQRIRFGTPQEEPESFVKRGMVGNTLLGLLLLQLDHRQLAEDGWMMHKYICRRHN